ncbi:VWA domain-containing protein [Halothiobacillus sp. DCM-1]|uniref:VWA domain-containing protein n=1 Tax=Halothiobacillus sp. DCM-1 TaxID=3112558 RepID=UPI00324F4FB2
MPAPHPSSCLSRRVTGHLRPHWLLLVCTLFWLGCARAETPPELHVLIDVSGSMKHTDPQNLRQPALRLLGDLLPPSAWVGVWFFGDKVTAMLPPKPADAASKARLRAIANRIRSNEPFTDIPHALSDAAAKWQTGTDRNILLLSDGMVDISPDPAINARAQQALLDTLIPKLRAERIRVHTIALSKEADSQLLAKIAADTGGIFVAAESADQLQRAFLKIFEAAAPRDGLPLKDNKFLVDPSVKELTILAFRDQANQPNRLKRPDGQIIGIEQSRQLPGWRWDDSGGRDLITIENPPPGQWQIIGAKDPDNRALILTDLKLRLTELPTRIYPGEVIDGNLHLTNHDQIVSQPALTQVIKAELQETRGNEVIQAIPLNDQGADPDIIGGDGRFNYRLHLIDPVGIYSLVATAKSPTFQRDWRQNFAMAPQAPIQLTAHSQAAQGTVPASRSVTVTQDPTVIEPGKASLTGEWLCQNSPNHTPAKIPINLVLSQTIQTLPAPTPNDVPCTLQAELQGTLTTGRSIRLELPPLNLVALAAEQTTATTAPSRSPLPATQGGIQWWGVLIANLIALPLLGLSIWLWRRRARRTIQLLILEAKT